MAPTKIIQCTNVYHITYSEIRAGRSHAINNTLGLDRKSRKINTGPENPTRHDVLKLLPRVKLVANETDLIRMT